jgi:hypothetical protein
LPLDLRTRADRLARLRAARERLEAEVREQQVRYGRRLQERARKEAALPPGKHLRGRKPLASPERVPAEAKANATDPDSRLLRDGQRYLQGCNAQAAVGEGQIVLACDLVSDSNDRHQLVPMINATRDGLAALTTGEGIGVVLADAGYWDTDALEQVVASGQQLIVNPVTSNPRRPQSSKPYPRAPRVEGIRLQMHETISSDDGRALYAKRGELAEPVFAQIKVTRRCDRFLRRGLAACRSEWTLVCATHNLLKLWRHTAATTA